MTGEWLEREALGIVKTYPTPSVKYIETVCVAAITREEGWVRLYPVGFRSLQADQQFKKYQRIRLRMKKHDRDPRPESYRPDENSIQLDEVIGTNDKRRERWKWIRPTIGPSMCELQQLQKSHRRSLGSVKVRDVSDLVVKPADVAWSGRKQSLVDQSALFDSPGTKLEKIPFEFRYWYRCEDPKCRGHKQLIIDWEIMELYRKARDPRATPEDIAADIRKKFLEELCSASKDTHFFVGNHSRYLDAFMVLGVFWPPKSVQNEMF